MILTLTCPVCGESWQADAQAGSSSPCRNPNCPAAKDSRPKRVKVTRAMIETAQQAAGKPRERWQAAGELDNGVRLADVDAATACVHPAPRAMIRLMLSAVCVRYHLCEARPGGHLSGLAAGPTQRGKTLAAAVICRALGLDDATCIRQTGREAELSLWGRRAQEPGGRYVLTPAAVLGLPFVTLDVLDKATGALLKAALRLLHDDARMDAEGQPVDIAPTAYATRDTYTSVLPDMGRAAAEAAAAIIPRAVSGTGGLPTDSQDKAPSNLRKLSAANTQVSRPGKRVGRQGLEP